MEFCEWGLVHEMMKSTDLINYGNSSAVALSEGLKQEGQSDDSVAP